MLNKQMVIGFGIGIVILLGLLATKSYSDDVYFLKTETGGGESTVCTSTGSGNSLCNGGNVNITSLIAGSGIIIANTTDDYTISTNSTEINTIVNGNSIGQTQAVIDQQVTKTNIGTSYVDIYTGSFEEESRQRIHCEDDFTEMYFLYTWGYVGTGNHQVRFVDASNNVFFEFTASASSFDPRASGWFDKPAFCSSGIKAIEMQGKSTVSTDDPISYGWILFTR